MTVAMQPSAEVSCVRCGHRPTCEAHIIPAAFLKFAVLGNNHLKQLGPKGTKIAKRQLGLADPNILCSSCDAAIGTLDKYAIEFCRNFSRPMPLMPYDVVPLPGLDVDKIRLFAISVVWRASISQLLDLQQVNLGIYNQIASDLVFGVLTPDDCSILHVQMNFLFSNAGPTSSFVTYPVKCRNGVRSYHIFVCGGFQFLVYFGNVPFAEGNEVGFANLLKLQSKVPPKAVAYPLEEAGEFEIVKMAARADKNRKTL